MTLGTKTARSDGVKARKFGKCQNVHTNPMMRLLTRAE